MQSHCSGLQNFFLFPGKKYSSGDNNSGGGRGGGVEIRAFRKVGERRGGRRRRRREKKERSRRKIEERREKQWMTVQKNPIDPRSGGRGGGSARGKPPRPSVQIRSGGGSNPGWGLLKATGCRPTVGIRVVEGKSRLTVTRYPLP